MKVAPFYAGSWQYSHMGVPSRPQYPVFNYPQNVENKRPARTNPTKANVFVNYQAFPQAYNNCRAYIGNNFPQNDEYNPTRSLKTMKNAEMWTDVFKKNLSEVFIRKLDIYSRDLIRDDPLKMDKSVIADFVCENRLRAEKKVCGRSWDSTQVTVTFLYEIELARNRGVIHIKEYGQKCQRCSRSNTFATPTIDYESADRAAKKLKQKILEKFYGEIPQEFQDSSHGRMERKKPHDKANCEACLNGVCSAIEGRRDGGPRWRPEREVNAVVSHGRNIRQWVLKLNDSHEEIEIGKKPKSNCQKTKKGGIATKPEKLSAQNNQPNQTTPKKSATKLSTSKKTSMNSSTPKLTATTKASSATTKPGSATAKPGSGTTKPGSATAKPGSAPGSTTTKPVSAATKPSSATAKPGSATTKPVSAATKPVSAATKPSSAATKPGSATAKPGSATAKPGSAATKPGSATTKPGSAATKPVSATTKPVSATTKPGSAATKPGSAAAKPGSATTKPGSATNKPGSAATQPSSATAKTGSATAKSLKQTTEASSKSTNLNAITDKKSEDDAIAKHKIRKRNRKRKIPKTEDQKRDKSGGQESKNYTIARDLIMDDYYYYFPLMLTWHQK